MKLKSTVEAWSLGDFGVFFRHKKRNAGMFFSLQQLNVIFLLKGIHEWINGYIFFKGNWKLVKHDIVFFPDGCHGWPVDAGDKQMDHFLCWLARERRIDITKLAQGYETLTLDSKSVIQIFLTTVADSNNQQPTTTNNHNNNNNNNNSSNSNSNSNNNNNNNNNSNNNNNNSNNNNNNNNNNINNNNNNNNNNTNNNKKNKN